MVSGKRLALILILLACTLLLFAEIDEAGQMDTMGAKEHIYEGDETEDSYDVSASPLPMTDAVDLKTEFLAGVSKEEVINLLPDYRKGTLGHNRHFDRPYSYNWNYDFLDLNDDALNLNFGGHKVLSGVYPLWHYLGNYSLFHRLDESQWAINGENIIYDLPVSLSMIEGSLGDYDSRYALFSFAKEAIFGLRGLRLKADYLMQNGYWLDYHSSRDASKLLMSYDYKDARLTLDLANYQRQGSSYELNPAYWHLDQQKVHNLYSYRLISFSHPWFSLSYLSQKDHSYTSKTSPKLKLESNSIAIDKALQNEFLRLKGRYEYRHAKIDHIAPLAYNHFDYDNLAELGLELFSPLKIESSFKLMDWQLLQSFADISHQYSLFQYGLKGRAFTGHREERMEITKLDKSGTIDYIDIFSPWEATGYISFKLSDITFSGSAGYKEEKQISKTRNLDFTPFIAGVSTEYSARFNSWGGHIYSAWDYRQFNKYFLASPEYRFALSLMLTKYLEYDNEISFGLSLKSHSGYYLANEVNPYLIEASSILDGWAQLKITRLFSFQVSANNLLFSSYHGQFPTPFSIHAGLRWYFIN